MAHDRPMAAEADDAVDERVRTLASLRGETVQQVAERFGEKRLRRLPRSFSKHLGALTQAEIAESGTEEGMAWLRLPGGQVFYGHVSTPKMRREYEFVADRVPHVLSADTYLLGIDVVSRYLTDVSWYPSEYLPGPGETVVEVGAYLGHKSLRFRDQCVGERGRVVAIEMMPENVAVLRRNIAANEAEQSLSAVACGVWNQEGTLRVRGVGRQRNSLVELDKLRDELDVEVPTRPLDAIITEQGLGSVEFLVVTANGAEIEALEGLRETASAVKAMYVAACYTRGGVPTLEPCLDLVRKLGFQVEKVTRGGEIYARR